MAETVKIVSPVDGRVYAERPVASAAEIDSAVSKAKAARKAWGEITVRERAKFLNHFVDALLGKNEEIVPELAWQMGRPIRYGGERRGVEERSRYMIDIAEKALAPEEKPGKEGFKRWIAHEPLGTTTGSSPANVLTVCRTTLREAIQSPPLNAGCPQHVCPAGKTTSTPRCSSTSTVAAATSS